MTSYEAYQHIKRAGWKENVVFRTFKEFTAEGAILSQTTITSTEWSYTKPTTEEACAHVLGWLKLCGVKPQQQGANDNPSVFDQWRFADEEAREQHEQEVMAMRLNDQSCSSVTFPQSTRSACG